MQGALKEVGIKHRFVYGDYNDPKEIEKIVSYCRASAEINNLNMSTVGVLGGRGMGQTCGVADPSQWMKMFGIDIDSRDTTELLTTAQNISLDEIKQERDEIQPFFAEPIPDSEAAEKSIRLYIALKK